MVPQNFRGSGGAGVISALYDDASEEWLERARDTQPRVARSSAGVSAPNATCFHEHPSHRHVAPSRPKSAS
jgi:hypothetical protein